MIKKKLEIVTKNFLMSYSISSEIFMYFGLPSQKLISKEISLSMRENILERWLAVRLESARGSLANASAMTHLCRALIG